MSKETLTHHLRTGMQKYPWTEDPALLPNKKGAVEATFLRTERQLRREPEWKTAYTAQVYEMVERP